MADPPSPPIDLPSSPPRPQRSRRKRTRLAFQLDDSTPSDPPLFSSDPPDPSVDNYFSPRRKRQYKGTWWGPEPESDEAHNSGVDQTSKSEFARNLDSGVFMSDSTEDSLSSDGPTIPNAFEGLQRVPHGNGGLSNNRNNSTRLSTSSMSSEERMAREVIQQCLDNESEIVDLSGWHLETLPDDIFQPLNSLIKQPRFLDSGNSPKDFDFHPLQPSLQLFLSGNSLRSLPMSMYNLENVSVLSLRNNNLESLSPHLHKLHNLVELNIANNGLRTLPWELLSLLRSPKLRTLTVLPNPLLKPFAYETFLHGYDNQQFAHLNDIQAMQNMVKNIKTYMEEEEENTQVDRRQPLTWLLHLHLRYMEAFLAIDGNMDMNHEPTFMASTPVTHFNMDGSFTQDPRQPPPPSHLPGNIEILPAILGGSPSPCSTSRATCVPSLLELATLSASTVPQLPHLSDLLPEDAPEPVLRVLEEACRARKEGGRLCSVCGRNYIVRRTEWVEYWHLPPKVGGRSSREEMFWPFLRRGCSVGCVPDFGARNTGL
ncbi:hypothetical protein EJ08DRAFT_653071 [Tothia fuscella]|uniref:Uncharacterized protein n=1 Tax=Tothia fuscella TaxID=1048955 RepID=A0A9P4NIJ7_9PEZI|nr:hypothetical protein EJ08DRAFT_653071 [Tothia fuscella]